MATTIKHISQFLDRRGWLYQANKDANTIRTRVEASQLENLVIVIELTENGEYLSLRTSPLVQVKDHVYKGVLFQTLLTIASESKLLRWEYEPTTGDIRASVGLALEDATLTEKQFNRLLNGLIYLVDDVSLPRIKSVLATGEDKGDRSAAIQVISMVERFIAKPLDKEAKASLEQAIAQQCCSLISKP
ncbi:hypothetical protein [Merismopedia glauca]|uniref:Uncharacterized protein n=1 Tax=Merismopedia glauca CCAP 1448/3 TaxID=1296344 RepID=A0A2T1BZ82_9CYAN|nr:hypothetical protein [Merismopedia glauca]PSB01183.1 hypothetical protein C7B64_19645 [Merismopedia glauca CCAP 1448/3]